MHVVPIKKTDAAKQIVMGEVYVPDRLDSQGEYMTAEEIEKAAWGFMRKSHMGNVDQEHDLQKTGADIVESFIAREGDPDFIVGSWVVAVKVPDEQWEMVQKGELNGFSMFGESKRVERSIIIELPDDGVIKGETLESQNHTHQYHVEFDAQGNFLGGRTSEDAGHFHLITKGTATEETAGHSHRYSFLENANAVKS